MRIRARTRRAAAVAAVAVAFVLVASGCSGASVAVGSTQIAPPSSLSDQTVQQLKTAVTDAMTATGSSGAIAGVWVPWAGSWVTGLGTVSPSDSTAVSTDMTFRAGPLTRPMICDVLYALAANGTVKLDDTVTHYLNMPGFPAVTLKQLCDGTSGIGSYGSILGPQALGNPDRQWDPNELIGYGVSQMTDATRPGSSYTGADAGYLLLGLVLERVTGRTSAQLLRQYVFSPLGMEHTALPGAQAEDPTVDGSTALDGYFLGTKDAAGAYVCTKPTEITQQSASYGFTNAGVVSSIEDLGTYVHALAAGSLVTSKDRFVGGMPVDASSPAWFTAAGGAIEAGPLVGQYGGVPGYLTAAFSDPASGLTVAVVLNDSTAGATAVYALAGELAAIASKVPAGAAAPAANGSGKPASTTVGLPWTADQYHAAVAQLAVCAAAKK